MPFHRLRQLFSSSSTAPSAAPVFTMPEGVRVYAVGDIHGRGKLLAKMLAAIERDARAHPTQKIVQVFLGDYIDRGLESKEVINLLLAPPPAGHERICLMGNHEAALLQFLDNPSVLREWANFGGYATLASYGIAIPDSMLPERLAQVRDAFRKNLSPAHETFIRNLQLSYHVGDYLFVHAGIKPSVPLAKQTRDDMLWIRDPFLKHKGFFEYYIVHGHTPVPTPEIYTNRANIDVSAAAKNSLCCMVVEGSAPHRVIPVSDEND